MGDRSVCGGPKRALRDRARCGTQVFVHFERRINVAREEAHTMAPHPMNRRQFLHRAGGAAIAMPSLSAILAACSKPSTSGASGSSPSTIPIATYDNPVTLPYQRRPHSREHADRVGAARLLQLGGLHLQARGREVRGEVRRRRGDHHLQQHGGGHREGRKRSGEARRLLPHQVVPAPVGPERPDPTLAARADPQHREHVAGLLARPWTVLRSAVAIRPIRSSSFGRGSCRSARSTKFLPWTSAGRLEQ